MSLKLYQFNNSSLTDSNSDKLVLILQNLNTLKI